MLSNEQEQLLQQSQTAFDAYYDALGASLVNFVERLGIQPAHEVLTSRCPTWTPRCARRCASRWHACMPR